MIERHAERLAVAFAAALVSGGCFSDPISSSNTTAAAESESESEADSETDSETGTGPGEERTIPLAADGDDGQIWINGGTYTWLPSGEDTGGFLGEFPQNSAYAGYFRFAIPAAIPAGSTILEARLALNGTTTFQWDENEYALEVAIQDVPDAPVVDLGAMYPYDANPDSVSLLQQRVRWPESGGLNWTVGDWNASPNLAPLIQALVDAQGGLGAGAHVQFWIIKAQPFGVSSEVGFVEFSDNPASAATLLLSFE